MAIIWRNLLITNYYRPQRSCCQGYVFTRVCDSVHKGGSGSVHAGIPPPPREACTPREAPSPGSMHPREACTPREADSSIRSMSDRYASYWNAFLLAITLILKLKYIEWKHQCHFSINGQVFLSGTLVSNTTGSKIRKRSKHVKKTFCFTNWSSWGKIVPRIDFYLSSSVPKL